MIFPLDLPAIESQSHEPVLVGPDEQILWHEFPQLVAHLQAMLPPLAGKRVALPVHSSPLGLAALIVAAQSNAHLYLMGAETSASVRQQWQQRFNWDLVLDPPVGFSSIQGGLRLLNEPSPRNEPRSLSGNADPLVTILTSGTTGEPKGVTHTWSSLSRPVRRGDPPGARWLLTYRPHLYAGLQVILQALLTRGTLAIPLPASTAQEVALLAQRVAIEYASATPSYWRWLLTSADSQTLGQIPLKQLTLGGEAVNQSILDSLRKTFPRTRIIHIYATTEMGRCFSVTDGREGFPARFLQRPSSDGVELRIENGQLFVRSANAMQGYDGPPPLSDSVLSDSATAAPQAFNASADWFATGDLVEIRGERVYFVGRTTDMINVGGNKVYPLEIERILQLVPGVAGLRVFGEPSSLVGELVACQWVLAAGSNAEQVAAELRQAALRELQPYQRPRIWEQIDAIPLTPAGKMRR